MNSEPPEFLDQLCTLFQAAVDAAAPERCVPPHLPDFPAGRTVVVGAGKAAAAMAAAVERNWLAEISGLVVTANGHGVPLQRIQSMEALHPVPDELAVEAAQNILETVSGLGPDDLVLCLISGGGSALMALPAPGITFADKKAINRALLLSGAPISEINCVRKHLSAIKGGRLAVAAAPARVVTLIISDVPGDDPATVASGPTVADPTSFGDAREVLARYRIPVPDAVADHLDAGHPETPKPGDERLDHCRCVVVARAMDALDAAAAAATALGWQPEILGAAMEGEAKRVAGIHGALALSLANRMEADTPPRLLISGGETTVSLDPMGGDEAVGGGRNTEYLLALALALDGHPAVHALACDTDGIDGNSDAAGAVLDPGSLARVVATGRDPVALLDAHASRDFFAASGGLVVTGPTRTNVNDFRAVLIATGSSVIRAGADRHMPL